MARLLNGSTQYLENTNGVLTSMPITMACWFRSSSSTLNQTIMAMGASGSGDRYTLGAFGAVAGDFLQVNSVSGGTTAAVATTAGYSVDTWHHSCGVFASATSRSVYIDGGNKGTNVTSNTPGGTIDRTSIGARNSLGVYGVFLVGRVAEAGIWNVALTDQEVAALASGVLPTQLRPEALVAYWPLWGDASPEPDWHTAGGTRYPMTLGGTPTKANHAPIAVSRRFWGGMPQYDEAAPGALLPHPGYNARMQELSGRLL